MRIALGSDHRGDAASGMLAEHLTRSGHEVTTLGGCGAESRDYPDAAWLVAREVAEGRAECGILLCSNGIGMTMAANKVDGVRAALIYDVDNAERSRQHNDANVLCLGGETNSHKDLMRIVDAWIAAEFEGGRHARRVAKMAAIERGEDPTRVATAIPDA